MRFTSVFIALLLSFSIASAQETAAPAAPTAPVAKAKSGDAWPGLTVSFGPQMWQPIYVGANPADTDGKPTLGGVLKVNGLLNANMGWHVRGAYGVAAAKMGPMEFSGSAWAAGLGMDVYYALNKKVMWSNSMGLAYGMSQATITMPVPDGNGGMMDREMEGPDASTIGAYFITTFDVTMFGDLGFWMDWGCQVVGPTTAEHEGDFAGQNTSVWHINPLGAGGFRYAF